MRALGLVAVILASWMFPQRSAQAMYACGGVAYYSPYEAYSAHGGGTTFSSREAAYAACSASAAMPLAWVPIPGWLYKGPGKCIYYGGAYELGYVTEVRTDSSLCSSTPNWQSASEYDGSTRGVRGYFWSNECPVGTLWNDTLHSCVDFDSPKSIGCNDCRNSVGSSKEWRDRRRQDALVDSPHHSSSARGNSSTVPMEQIPVMSNLNQAMVRSCS